MSTWEPFTERARRSMVLAQEEAQRLGNNYIGAEHILLGIMAEGDSLAARVLETLGVNLAKVRLEVHAVGGRTFQEMVLTRTAKRVIELASDEARRLNHNYIGTEHLLLGLIREDHGVIVRALVPLGVDLAKARIGATRPVAAPSVPSERVIEIVSSPDVVGTTYSTKPKWCAGLAATLEALHSVVDQFIPLAVRVIAGAGLLLVLFHDVIRAHP